MHIFASINKKKKKKMTVAGKFWITAVLTADKGFSLWTDYNTINIFYLICNHGLIE